MKIAIINITTHSISGGYKKYLLNIIPRMASDPRVEKILCACPESIGIKNRFTDIANVEFTDCRNFSLIRKVLDNKLKKKLREFSPDVIFVPTERYFKFPGIPVVTMIQNMEPFVKDIERPIFMEKIKSKLQYLTGKYAVKKADRVIAISDFVKQFMINELNISADKIGTVYHGVEVTPDTEKPYVIPDSWKRRFILTAGSIRPARGLEDIVFALDSILSENKNIAGLVITGEYGKNTKYYYKQLSSYIKKKHIEDRVFFTGSLSEEEMAWCYNNCSMFIMTSRVESFGIIAAEAMAYGCICVSSDNPCMPEIFGDAAVYYSASDSNSLIESFNNIIKWNDDKTKNAKKRAKERASNFSWDICTQKTITELSSVTGKQEIEEFEC